MGDSDGFSYRLEPREGYLCVQLTGTFTTEAQMEELQRSINTALEAQQTYRALFDNRDATPSDEELRASMYTWLTTNRALRRVAIVVHSTRITRRADNTAQLNRLPMKAFNSIQDAEAWLFLG